MAQEENDVRNLISISEEITTKDNKPAPHITIIKQMEDTYYIIEAVSDAKSKENHIVSMYKNIELSFCQLNKEK